jgi:hypothetical protein
MDSPSRTHGPPKHWEHLPKIEELESFKRLWRLSIAQGRELGHGSGIGEIMDI